MIYKMRKGKNIKEDQRVVRLWSTLYVTE